MDWLFYQWGYSETRAVSQVNMGLGAAGTLGSEGQAAFSCGRPISAAPIALADLRRRGLVESVLRQPRNLSVKVRRYINSRNVRPQVSLSLYWDKSA
jgi:hypothetical protein